MIYLLVKAAHLVAMVTWMAGMIAVPLILSGFGAAGPSLETRARLRSAFGVLCTPAMLVVWAAGLTIATQGGWFGDAWLQVKLTMVIVLSGLHGAMAGQLRRVAAGGPVPAFARNLHWGVLAILATIVVLAVVKPG